MSTYNTVAAKDRRERLKRTLQQAGVLSATAVALTTLGTALGSFELTRTWVVGTATAVATSFVMALVAYWHAKLKTPDIVARRD